MKKRQSGLWIPFWIDKWIFGSMRIEFNTEERGVWVDLMCLAGKDDGFIRANEDIAYPYTQLAGMLIIPEDLLIKTIEKFIKAKKLTLKKNGVLYITEWEKYQLSRTAKYYTEKGRSEQSCSQGDKKRKPEDNRIEDKENIIYKYTVEEIEKHFKAFWETYPHKMSKPDAYNAFKVLIKKEGIEIIASATNGYNGHLKAQRVKKGIDLKEQMDYIMYPASFLRKEKWKDFIGVVYKPKL